MAQPLMSGHNVTRYCMIWLLDVIGCYWSGLTDQHQLFSTLCFHGTQLSFSSESWPGADPQLSQVCYDMIGANY